MATNTSVTVQSEGGSAALTTGQTKHKRFSWFKGDTAIAFLVLSPSIIAVALFIYVFIVYTFYVSTVKWDSSITDMTFVGLKNWSRLFQDPRFDLEF